VTHTDQPVTLTNSPAPKTNSGFILSSPTNKHFSPTLKLLITPKAPMTVNLPIIWKISMTLSSTYAKKIIHLSNNFFNLRVVTTLASIKINSNNSSLIMTSSNNKSSHSLKNSMNPSFKETFSKGSTKTSRLSVNNSPDKSLSSEKNLPPKSKTKGLQETPTKHSTSKIKQPKKSNDFPSNTSRKCINQKTLIVAKIRRKNFTINPANLLKADKNNTKKSSNPAEAHPNSWKTSILLAKPPEKISKNKKKQKNTLSNETNSQFAISTLFKLIFSIIYLFNSSIVYFFQRFDFA
jgi:hypothetical protein